MGVTLAVTSSTRGVVAVAVAVPPILADQVAMGARQLSWLVVRQAQAGRHTAETVGLAGTRGSQE
jgi:hypothetical protein